jgi:hypothetical protein
MQNNQTPLTVEFNQSKENHLSAGNHNVVSPNTQTDQITKKDIFGISKFQGFKFQQLTAKDFYFYENKEMWISSFLYCILMDRIYTQKYLIINSKSLRLSCTIMNILIPYFFLFHSKIIYQNYLVNKN